MCGGFCHGGVDGWSFYVARYGMPGLTGVKSMHRTIRACIAPLVLAAM